MTDFTTDKFLDGRVSVRQPKKGFRSGLDAVMLAAAVPAKKGESVLELGSGAGAASLCLAARVGDCEIAGVEVDKALVAMANRNAADNGLAERVTFDEADALALPAWLRREFAHVLCNPPFHDEDAHLPPHRAKARATHDHGNLGKWLQSGLKRVAPKGTLTMIIRADRLKDLLGRAPEDGVTVFPLWPHAIEPAKRLIVQIRKGAHAQSVMLPGLVLHEEDGRYTPEADAVLRGAGALKLSLR